ncbi:TPA: hypothetical protein OOF36_003318 [Morganella morganii]|nr:hypothetical protein [Morganella morganii]
MFVHFGRNYSLTSRVVLVLGIFFSVNVAMGYDVNLKISEKLLPTPTETKALVVRNINGKEVSSVSQTVTLDKYIIPNNFRSVAYGDYTADNEGSNIVKDGHRETSVIVPSGCKLVSGELLWGIDGGRWGNLPWRQGETVDLVKTWESGGAFRQSGTRGDFLRGTKPSGGSQLIIEKGHLEGYALEGNECNVQVRLAHPVIWEYRHSSGRISAHDATLISNLTFTFRRISAHTLSLQGQTSCITNTDACSGVFSVDTTSVELPVTSSQTASSVKFEAEYKVTDGMVDKVYVNDVLLDINGKKEIPIRQSEQTYTLIAGPGRQATVVLTVTAIWK